MELLLPYVITFIVAEFPEEVVPLNYKPESFLKLW